MITLRAANTTTSLILANTPWALCFHKVHK